MLDPELPVVEVTWLDAADHKDISLSEILRKPTRDYLMERKTFGRLAKEDKQGVVIIFDIDESNECQICTIPKPFIKKVVRKKK